MTMMHKSLSTSRWLLFLTACALCGCASLPEQEKGIWPWEYGRGKGEPDTGDFIAVRAGVTKFGEPPKAVKPITPEVVAPPPPEAPAVSDPPEVATGPAAGEPTPVKASHAKKTGYDFEVRQNSSPLASLLPMDRSAARYDITAFNNGNAPVSVAIDIDERSSENTAADQQLPLFVVVPASTTHTLVHLSPKRQETSFGFSFRYTWSIGDFTAQHRCPEQYLFPFGETVRAFASVNKTPDATPYTRHALIFALPKGTPVLPARKGTVIQVTADGRIDILHEDATIGTYSHLEKIPEVIVDGKTVTTEDSIGLAGTTEDENVAFLQLTVWRPEPAPSDAVQTHGQKLEFAAVSFPLAFRRFDSDKGTVLTQSQQVSRGKLPAVKKQTKRK